MTRASALVVCFFGSGRTAGTHRLPAIFHHETCNFLGQKRTVRYTTMASRRLRTSRLETPSHRLGPITVTSATVELLWIPLGAGQYVVRISGRVFETLAALVARRPACDLYHSAFVVTVPDGRYVIEMTPIIDEHGDRRGVVAEGAVGSARLGKRRIFRYEIRRWLNGVIPDTASAKVTTSIELAYADALRLLELVPSVPTSVWGRDELAPARCGIRTR